MGSGMATCLIVRGPPPFWVRFYLKYLLGPLEDKILLKAGRIFLLISTKYMDLGWQMFYKKIQAAGKTYTSWHL